eukprot:TRINITY_DN2702_c0_g3_i2.p1 TRINITY_DN2702_c0_g3~~TRINITY_DN2702_c0_g3_i2.p1  ORF type:complete len:165 (+),score=17.06 TRINITY_DN2702_c0_g3_i2:2-496(+)
MNWGAVQMYQERKGRLPDVGKGEKETPEFLKELIRRICDKSQPWAPFIGGWTPNEGNINSYIRSRGDKLPDHFDDRALSGPILAVVTLTGSASVTFKTFPKNASQPQIDARQVAPLTTTKIHCPTRCLQLVTGPSRYNYTHGIENTDLSEDRRVSVVLRQVKVA